MVVVEQERQERQELQELQGNNSIRRTGAFLKLCLEDLSPGQVIQIGQPMAKLEICGY